MASPWRKQVKWGDSSPSKRTQGPTNQPSDPSPPLLVDLQASAVSDSNTRQRQNTQLHKDTRSRLQETDTPKKRWGKRRKEFEKERDYSPWKGLSGRRSQSITNQTPKTTQNRPSVGETLTQRTCLTTKQKSERHIKEDGGELPEERGNKDTGGSRDGCEVEMLSWYSTSRTRTQIFGRLSFLWLSSPSLARPPGCVGLVPPYWQVWRLSPFSRRLLLAASGM